MLARDVGQVRDVLACFTEDGDLTSSYPRIDAAVDALGRTQTSAPPAHGPQSLIRQLGILLADNDGVPMAVFLVVGAARAAEHGV